MSSKITHSGVIERIQGECLKVRIVQTSACAACKVASHCHAAESKVKIVDVRCINGAVYHVGQEVMVSVSKHVANKALLLGFGVPFLLLVSVLVIVLKVTSNEGVAALSALGSLIPYYLLLWLLRHRIGQEISFQIEDK